MTPEMVAAFEETIPAMLSDDPEDILGAELEQCKIRMKAMQLDMGKIALGELESGAPLTVLLDQIRMMDAYISILTSRMATLATARAMNQPPEETEGANE